MGGATVLDNSLGYLLLLNLKGIETWGCLAHDGMIRRLDLMDLTYQGPQLVFLLIWKVVERHHSLMRMSVVHHCIHMVFIWSIIHLTYCWERLTPIVGCWTSSWSHGPVDQHSVGDFIDELERVILQIRVILFQILVVSASGRGCIALMFSSLIRNPSYQWL